MSFKRPNTSLNKQKNAEFDNPDFSFCKRAVSIQEQPQLKKYLFTTNLCGL